MKNNVKTIDEIINAIGYYQNLCVILGIEPTLENAIALKRKCGYEFE